MWAWVTTLLKNAVAAFLTAQLPKILKWFGGLFDKWMHKLKMKKVRKAIDKKDNISVEKAINNPDAGEPSHYDGVQRRGKKEDKS